MTTTAKVAVPYYGNLTHPRTGLSNLFFLATIGEGQTLELSVWDSQQHPRLADWFRSENVTGLLCRERDHHHLGELKREGIWVVGGSIGEPEQIYKDWIGSMESNNDIKRVENQRVL